MEINEDILTDEGKVICDLTNIFKNKNREIERLNNVIYKFDDHYGDYYNKELDRYLFVYMTSEEEWKLSYFLNIQVEILEEQKKIPEKLNIELNSDDENKVNYYRATNLECDLAFKINSIIDYLKSKGE